MFYFTAIFAGASSVHATILVAAHLSLRSDIADDARMEYVLRTVRDTQAVMASVWLFFAVLATGIGLAWL